MNLWIKKSRDIHTGIDTPENIEALKKMGIEYEILRIPVGKVEDLNISPQERRNSPRFGMECVFYRRKM